MKRMKADYILAII